MSVCSSEVCDLSEKKTAMRAMGSLLEEPSRASPIPFIKGEVVSEQFQASTQGALRKSENVESSDQGNVQITRKSKVEETFERTQKMYTAEVTSSSQSTMQVRAASPEMEQIMAKRRAQMAYDSPNQTPTTVSNHFKHLQSERCLTPEMEHLMNKPHGTWSPMPPACMVRPLSPNQVVSFPPDMPLPPLPTNLTQPRAATPEQFQEARETVERFVDHSKHVQQSQTSSSNRSNQTFNQQTAFSSHSQQYTPRFDSSQGFSPYVPKGNGNNYQHNGANNEHTSESHQNQNNGYQQSGRNQNYENDRNQEQSQPNVEKEPEVEEPDDREEEKWSKQEEKSQKKASAEEEESSRRVFSDFGGPQVLSSVDIESTLEGGIEKTSVKKSQKTQYASCEFETSRKSAVHQHDKSSSFAAEAEAKSPPTDKPSEEVPPTSDKEETMTKSQVEEIIKQELNKVFHMAQTMEKTDYSQMYNQQSQAQQQSKQEREHTHDKTSKSKVEQKAISSQYDIIKKTGKLTSALTTAPGRTFTPQPLENNYPLPYQNIPSDFPPPRPHPEPPVVEKQGYIPITGGRDSPLVKALTIACDRPYDPLPIPTAPEVPTYATQPNRSSMLDALTTAPTTPFQIRPPSAAGEGLLSESKQVLKSTETTYESVQKFAPKPTQGDFKPISVNTSQKQQVQDELKSAFKSTSKVQSSFASSESKHTENLQQRNLSAPKPVERPITPSGLHPPSLLPYYQQNIGEIPLAHRSNSPIPHQIKAPSVTPPRAQSVPRQGERRGSVKAMSEAYVQQVTALNSQQTSPVIGASSSSVSYVSSGAYSKGSTVTKTYSYQQEHKSIDSGSYQASPLAGKLPLAGEPTMPKCSSPVLGKLDHTKQVFKPAIPSQQPTTAFRSPVAEQANLKQALPYFVEEKDKTQTPWVVVKDKEDEGNKVSFKLPQSSLPSRTLNLPNTKPLPSVIPKPASLPGVTKPPSLPDVGPGAPKGGATGSTSAPRRGRGVLNAAVAAGGRVPLCGSCNSQIRGPFITALGKIWCPEHFVCVNANCRRPLQDIGFVEDVQGLYCEFCFEQYLAPACSKCNAKIKGDCLNAIGKHFHPECFTCAYCGKLFGNSPFFLEDALPYCEADWNELFTTKCFSCGFPIEAGDRWVEALNNNYHSQCFNCTSCKKNLEGQSFFAKGGRPFCKNHAR